MIYKKAKQKITKEYLFLNDFILTDFFDEYKNLKKYDYTLIQEPYTGFGYPDLVCILWDKAIAELWNKRRNKLKLNDIKILHHLFVSKKYKQLDELVFELGSSRTSTLNSIEALFQAKLINITKNDKYKSKPLSEIFFIKEIIAIEAKLKDWKKALYQSINNTYFSSKSYTLIPEPVVKEKVIARHKESGVGLISFGNNCHIWQKPKRNDIPSTLNSWLFNEYMGRENWN